MSRIFEGNRLAPTDFFESNHSNSREPYTISVKHFPEDDTAIPHYSPAAFLFVSNGANGVFQMDSRSIRISGKSILYIPPNRIHSSTIKKGEGIFYVFKFFPQQLLPYLGLEQILNANDCTLYGEYFYTNDRFDEIEGEICRLIREDGNELACMQSVLRIMELLLPHLKRRELNAPLILRSKNDYLKKLIAYSEEHFAEGITNRDAASFIGYNDNYFCRWFREMTGITYTEYLMRLKINRACVLLEQGHGIRETAELLGYTNVSFFMRKFKSYLHCTPGDYRRNALKNDPAIPNEGGFESK
ncbi:MAG: helix-turn-helix transcriptional regulator [Ruminococcaceae bacterium]|nr:helix-turn-helix transcriptional regulator [Oscillospiraceae bacterium]